MSGSHSPDHSAAGLAALLAALLAVLLAVLLASSSGVWLAALSAAWLAVSLAALSAALLAVSLAASLVLRQRFERKRGRDNCRRPSRSWRRSSALLRTAPQRQRALPGQAFRR